MEKCRVVAVEKKCCSKGCPAHELPTCDACGRRMRAWTESTGKRYCSEACFRTAWPHCAECDLPMQQWYAMPDGRKLCEACVPTCAICGAHLSAWQEGEDGLIYCSDYCRDIDVQCVAIWRHRTANNRSTAGAALGSVGNAQQYAENVTLTQPRGHGIAAEWANTFIDKVTGKHARHVGGNNLKNGPDRVVNGSNIQTKYCNSGAKCIQECFSDGQFRYFNADGTPMQVEVPADKYESAIQAMEDRIRRGQIPTVQDPARARDIVRKGIFTYTQVRNMAKFGTIESLAYDSVTHAITATGAFGISALMTYAQALWNGQGGKAAIKLGLVAEMKVGGVTWIAGLMTAQIQRTGVDTVLRHGADCVVEKIGPRAAAWLARGLSGGKSVCSGAAAMKHAAKLLRGNVLTGAVMTAVLSATDIFRLVRGKISGAQAFKNMATTTACVAGGTGGWVAGAAAGASVGSAVPLVGTMAGGMLGGILGGLAGGVAAGKLSKAALDRVIKDDATQMMRLLEKHFARFAAEFLLSKAEINQVGAILHKQDIHALLRNLYASHRRDAYAARILRPIIIEVISQRPPVALPGKDEMNTCINEIADEAA